MANIRVAETPEENRIALAQYALCHGPEITSLAQFDRDLAVEDDRYLNEIDQDDLTTALQRSTRQEVREYIHQHESSEVESTALLFAHEALHTGEGRLFEPLVCIAWDDQCIDLMDRAQTAQERTLVGYADAAMQSV